MLPISWSAALHVRQQPHLSPVAKCLFRPSLKMSMKSFVLITSTLTISVCFFVTDTVINFFAAYVVPDASVHHAVLAFESC